MAAWGSLTLRAARPKPAKPKSCRCRLNRPERLENRLLMTANAGGDSSPWLHSAGVCSCPVCTGIGLDLVPTAEIGSADPAASNPLSSLPQLSSNPNASAKLYLDFNGHFQASWGSWSNAATPVYDQDGDATTFSSGELTSIYDIWARVAEDFAPFNINVTTIDPGSLANQVVAHIAIGGSSSDWFGSSAGGVAYVGGFYNSAPNVGYVFENNLGNGHAKYVAEAASHEAGHLFGLSHQATWSGGTMTESYNSGNGSWAPIMGVGYYAPRTTWHNGATASGPSAYQDDMSILANSSNGFGYRPDDFGSTRATASTLAVNGVSVNFSGLIGRADDTDVWPFSTGGGSLSFQLVAAASGANLDSVLEIWDANGNVIATDSPSGAQGASVSAAVGAGTFYLVARGLGDYGDIGQYTITGSVPAVAAAPEIAVSVAGGNLANGATLSFGSTTVGAPVTRTVTVTNQGSGTLTLSSLAGATLPPGYSLVSDLGSTTLAAGQSTSFSVRLDAASAGPFLGTLSILSNDGDEGQFSLTLSGSAAVAEQPVIRIADNGDAGHTRTGSWTRSTGKGYGNDIDTAPRGNGSIVSNWRFYTLPAGQYRVFATWTTGSKNASNAPFTLIDGSTTRTTIRVSQRVAPSGLTSDGANWKLVGTVTVNSGQLTVRLTNSANGVVVADAMRIEKVPAASAPATPMLATKAGSQGALGGELPTATKAVAAQLVSSGSANTATQGADLGPEQRALRDVLNLLAEVRKFTSHESAVDQLAGDEQALSELLSPLT